MSKVTNPEDPIFYTYLILDPRIKGTFIYDDGNLIFDYLPIYGGKGYDERCNDHMKDAINTDKESDKLNLLREIIEKGYEPYIIKIIENVTEKEAFTKERHIIRVVGRADLGLGPLTNKTDGGEGSAGYVWDDEQKEKLKNRPNGMLGNNHSDEAKRKMSEKKKGKDTYAKGKILYTDGKINKYFEKNTQPVGWEVGQIRNKSHSNKGKKWYTDGNTVKLCYENEQPIGWELGYPPNKGKNSSNHNGLSKEHRKKIGEFRKGKQWYNNGEQQGQYYSDKRPESWIRGMLK